MTSGPGTARTPLPKKFLAGGINSGVRRYRPDLGIIISETDSVVAGVFTRNECKAAPVLYSQKLVPASNIKAIITNSGQANAATGEEGLKRNKLMIETAAHALNCKPSQVLAASTGVIGYQLDIEKIIAAIPEMVARPNETAEAFALSILTTDLVPKTVSTTVELSSGSIQITGICKGSGMIHPNMGTMLGYLLTDAILTADVAHTMLKEITELSFNMISVDGDSSTNDCVFLMANGASGIGLKNDGDYLKMKTALKEIAQFLAKSIARDGEGATKLIEVTLENVKDLDLCRKAARGITLSPLIKTAIHGEDPNWGRILSRLGAEGIPTNHLDKLTLKIQDVIVFDQGSPTNFNKPELKELLKRETVYISADFHSGKMNATAWGCDLSKRYVEINTEYT